MTQSSQRHPVLVLVADARSAKLQRRKESGELEEQWQLYSADHKVRGLAQSPDVSAPLRPLPTEASEAFAHRAFADQITDRLRETCEKEGARSIVLISPQRFADVLHASLGPALWGLVAHHAPRDETFLDQASLRRLVDTELVTAPAQPSPRAQ